MLAAVADNARWCDLVCRSHGLPTALGEDLWVAPEGAPRFYPDAVTLAPGMTAEAVLGGIAARPGSAVKDSFADVDLGSHGFAVLFEARWLFREPAPYRDRPRLGWDAVATEDEFDRWVTAADLEGILRPELLGDATVRLLLARGEGPEAAGAVVHATDGVAGLSNVFAAGMDPDAVWPDLPAVVRQAAGDLPIVGYEHGDELRCALATGFAAIGALRVWVRLPA
ncbi:MAG: Urea carboxylase [uncultured Thermoleophilia bacterium]|uniref:Urea carboxylase n=1 Tax=uncultured Thermoleophilia bacterium TaxID=1497501 RepID=A0A6J4TTV7_9ACTN|nr:MAG: Urea carboxylase [uncultured Thermoleophilia bacterium]